jgi:hypothetical protein
MTENFEIDALEYLLEEMEPERRAAFEALLARDPAARESLKACADALGRFACDTAPAEPMSAADQQAVLSTILTATHAKPLAPAQPENKVIVWSRFVWPIAAALLLGLNVYQLRQAPSVPLPGERSTREPSVAAAPRTEGELHPSVVALGSDTPQEVEADGKSTGTAGPAISAKRAVTRSSGPTSVAGQLDQLRRDYAELQRSSDALRADYNHMLRVVADRALVEKSVSRLATMELVDAASYDRGVRKGLMEVARGILTEPGVVVAEVTPPVTDPKTEENTVGTSVLPGSNNGGKDVVATDTLTPYAWSVFDDKERRGYLNLYNLPKTAGDQSLQLWVKTIDSSTYQRVGEVPAQFQGGNGSLYYNLPNATTVPSEILITQEARAAVGVAPAGIVVLRGP